MHAEPSDPVPESWHEPSVPGRDEPLLPPEQPVQDTNEPEPKVDAPVNDEPDEEPAPRLVARTSLPTDVRLVGGPKPQSSLTDTQPDGIKLPNTQPDGIPVVSAADDEEERLHRRARRGPRRRGGHDAAVQQVPQRTDAAARLRLGGIPAEGER